jgi:hypothetical protein
MEGQTWRPVVLTAILAVLGIVAQLRLLIDLSAELEAILGPL